jgi:hypothetical protein
MNSNNIYSDFINKEEEKISSRISVVIVTHIYFIFKKKKEFKCSYIYKINYVNYMVP